MSICYVEKWNPYIHGYDNKGFRPDGHFISTNEPIELDEFYSFKKDDFNIDIPNRHITLEIVKSYVIEDYVLCVLLTSKIIKLQRLWRKQYKRKIEHKKNIKSLLYRETTGYFPPMKN